MSCSIDPKTEKEEKCGGGMERGGVELEISDWVAGVQIITILSSKTAIPKELQHLSPLSYLLLYFDV